MEIVLFHGVLDLEFYGLRVNPLNGPHSPSLVPERRWSAGHQTVFEPRAERPPPTVCRVGTLIQITVYEGDTTWGVDTNGWSTDGSLTVTGLNCTSGGVGTLLSPK